MEEILERKSGESNFEYHKRLVYDKLVNKTLADVDYTEIAECLYGKAYASDVARRMMYGSRRTLDLILDGRESFIDDNDILNSIEMEKFELKKERQKLSDQRAALNKMLRERSRQEELNEIITECVQSGALPELTPTKQSYTGYYEDNDLLVSLNDIHYGANFKNYWGEYSPEICAAMMSRYLDKIIEIAKRNHSSKCYVWENGDAISGLIHKSIQITNKETVVKQIMHVSDLIAQFLEQLSPYFEQVFFMSVAGNHSRITPNKKESLVDERLDDLIDWYLMARLQNFENIQITGDTARIDPTMYAINIRDKCYVGVHGDFDPTPSKIQSIEKMVGRPVYAVLSGHLHHNKVDEVQGIKTVMAGSFMGMDDFCVQNRIIGNPQQMVCVVDNTGIVCHYDIQLKE